MSPAGGPVRGRYGDASGTCSRFWPCCSGLARPRRSQVRSARTAGRPHPSAVCGSSAVPASSPPARPGFGPRRRPPRCPRARVARGRRAEERGGAAALCPACPALAIHSLAAGLRAAPATAGPRERAARRESFGSKLGDQTSATPRGSWCPRRAVLPAEGHRGAGAVVAGAAVTLARALEVPAHPPPWSLASSLPAPERPPWVAPLGSGGDRAGGWQVSGEDSAVWSETTWSPTC